MHFLAPLIPFAAGRSLLFFTTDLAQLGALVLPSIAPQSDADFLSQPHFVKAPTAQH